MRSIYQILEDYQKPRLSINRSREYNRFLNNRYNLDRIPYYAYLYESETNFFNIMRANIILDSYLNKTILDGYVERINAAVKRNKPQEVEDIKKEMRERLKDLPYYDDNGRRIYIAFFNRAINDFYINHPERFGEYPYSTLLKSFNSSIVDAFDTYGYHIYNSTFTRLVKIMESENKKECAFIHYDTYTIYFINDQGRLENKMVLFDKFLERPSHNHLIERAYKVIDAYFKFNRTDTINALIENGFMSNKLFAIIRKEQEDEI